MCVHVLSTEFARSGERFLSFVDQGAGGAAALCFDDDARRAEAELMSETIHPRDDFGARHELHRLAAAANQASVALRALEHIGGEQFEASHAPLCAETGEGAIDLTGEELFTVLGSPERNIVRAQRGFGSRENFHHKRIDPGTRPALRGIT